MHVMHTPAFFRSSSRRHENIFLNTGYCCSYWRLPVKDKNMHTAICPRTRERRWLTPQGASLASPLCGGRHNFRTVRGIKLFATKRDGVLHDSHAVMQVGGALQPSLIEARTLKMLEVQDAIQRVRVAIIASITRSQPRPMFNIRQ